MNERMIQNALFQFRVDHAVVVPNVQMSWGESDLLSITRSGFICDHEIKISRSDFKADFGVSKARLHSITKALKHDALSMAASSRKAIPNYFIYVAPFEILTVHDIPPYAGLLVWHPSTWRTVPFGRIELVKKPPRLHDGKIEQSLMLKLARSLMHKYWHHRQERDPRCPGVLGEVAP